MEIKSIERIYPLVLRWILLATIFVIIVYPVFSRGVILTLDNVASPIGASRFLGISMGSAIYQKLLIVLMFGTGLLAVSATTKKLPFIVTISSVIFWFFNPFVAERIALGQWDLQVSIALFGVIIYLYSSDSKYKLVSSVALLTLCGKIYPRSISFLEIILVSLIIAWIITKKKFDLISRIIAGVIAVALTIYLFRVVGLNFGHNRLDAIIAGASQIELFQVGSGSFLQKIIGVLGYIGFWAEKAHRIPYNLSYYWWDLLGLVTLVISYIGLKEIFKINRLYGWFLIITYLLGFVLVLSNSGLVGADKLVIWYDRLGLVGLRETGKFMGMMLIAQLQAFALGVNYLYKSITFKLNLKSLLIGVYLLLQAIILPFSFYLMHWGLKTSQLPPKLISLAKDINTKNENNAWVIIFPWHRFQSYSFTNGKVVDQLTPSLFNKGVFSEMLEFNDTLTDSTDPWQQKMADATTKSEIEQAELKDLLIEKGIKTIVVMKTNDFAKYINWADKQDLKKIQTDDQFVAYRLEE